MFGSDEIVLIICIPSVPQVTHILSEFHDLTFEQPFIRSANMRQQNNSAVLGLDPMLQTG